MGIFSRLADIVNSNINSMLDHAEDPKKMIRLMVQEMEETLVEVRSSSVRMIADRKEIGRKIDYLKQEAAEWENKAKLAISKNREDLARAAINEKATVNEEVAILTKELAAITEHLGHLDDEVGQLQTKLSEAKAKQKALLLREKTATSRLKVKSQIQSGESRSAFEKFEAYERRLDELEGSVESMDLGSRKDLASEIDKLAEDDRINAELERLKKEMGSN